MICDFYLFFYFQKGHGSLVLVLPELTCFGCITQIIQLFCDLIVSLHQMGHSLINKIKMKVNVKREKVKQ